MLMVGRLHGSVERRAVERQHLRVVLLCVAFIDRNAAAASIIGPLHGLGFLLLLGMTGAGAYRRYWGWCFPALGLITGGPIGSLVGEVVLRRRVRDS
jgi:TRAP-type C4-dicarboxylate transport system permease small subunit